MFERIVIYIRYILNFRNVLETKLKKQLRIQAIWKPNLDKCLVFIKFKALSITCIRKDLSILNCQIQRLNLDMLKLYEIK